MPQKKAGRLHHEHQACLYQGRERVEHHEGQSWSLVEKAVMLAADGDAAISSFKRQGPC